MYFKGNKLSILMREEIFFPVLLVVAWFLPTTGPSLCFFKFIGFHYCPGCGIGRAIHETLHLNFAAATNHHFLGIPATIFLIFRTIYKLFKSKTNESEFLYRHTQY